MIICIESWKGDTYLSGKKRTLAELKNQIREVERLCDRAEDNFVPLLCRMYGWEVVPASQDTRPDYTYDADTALVLRSVL